MSFHNFKYKSLFLAKHPLIHTNIGNYTKKTWIKFLLKESNLELFYFFQVVQIKINELSIKFAQSFDIFHFLEFVFPTKILIDLFEINTIAENMF